ncbi:MAG: rhodanese-related sulfurtransferase [Cyclobacteriaceae bacterium]
MNKKAINTSNSSLTEPIFCKSIYLTKKRSVKEVTVSELKEMRDNAQDFQLVDVRELNEIEIAEIGGEVIPMGDIPDNIDKISKDKQVVIHCRSGARSGNIVKYLEQNHGFDNVYNLKGGILAWANEIDPTITKY